MGTLRGTVAARSGAWRVWRWCWRTTRGRTPSPVHATFAPDGAMYVGVDYYPSTGRRSAGRKTRASCRGRASTFVRLAEFSWVLLEPEEGRFDFAWLDRAPSRCWLATRSRSCSARHRRHACLGGAQCTAETLAMKADGTRTLWGGRKNNCFSDGTYRLLSERVTRAMAEHYAHHPAVIGWQIDNEFAGTDCRCGRCRSGFQDWLRARHGTGRGSQSKLGNHFWSLYSTPGRTFRSRTRVRAAGPAATRAPAWTGSATPPGSTSASRPIRCESLRDEAPAQFITHNFMGLFQEMDYYDLARDLDFVSWDNYRSSRTGTSPPSPTRRRWRPISCAVSRAGTSGSWSRRRAHSAGRVLAEPAAGEIRSIAYQQLAHGADAQLWFRWRTCTAGREQYWHGLLGHDGKPGRRYQEAAQVTKELRGLERLVAGTSPRPEVALVYDYDSLWALRIQPGYAGNTYAAALRRYFDAFFPRRYRCRRGAADRDLSRYKLVLAPDLFVLRTPWPAGSSRTSRMAAFCWWTPQRREGPEQPCSRADASGPAGARPRHRDRRV